MWLVLGGKIVQIVIIFRFSTNRSAHVLLINLISSCHVGDQN